MIEGGGEGAGNVLDERAAGRRIQDLRAAADREHGQIARQCLARERELIPIARRIEFDRRMPIGIAVFARIDVRASREQEAAAPVERRRERVVWRELTNTRASILERRAVIGFQPPRAKGGSEAVPGWV